MRKSNSKEQVNVFILKTIYEQVRYLDVFCYKAIVFSQVCMWKITKEIF